MGVLSYFLITGGNTSQFALDRVQDMLPQTMAL